MADPPPYPDTGDDTGMGPDGGSTTGTPRWVKVFGIIALVLVVLVGILLVTGGGPGGHGPGRHTGGQGPASSTTESGAVGAQTPSARVTASGGVGGHKPPAGGHTP